MSVALIAWGRFYRRNKDGSLAKDQWGKPIKITVPAPNTDPDKPWLCDFVAQQAPQIARAGFDVVQWPPYSKALGGAGDGCDGYGTFDRRDIGSKKQQGSRETRYGSAEGWRRAIACLKANGVESFLDIVVHQLMGENGGPGIFKYLGADGKTFNGRGQTTPGWFRGNTGNNDPVPPFCKEDAVPNVFYDYPFGRELSYQNCHPRRVTIEDALDYGDWLFRTTGAVGARFDDVKGTWAAFVAEFMNSRAMKSKEFYSEYFEGNPATLNWWATSAPMNGRSGVEDFTNHWAIQSACDGGNARVLNGAGYTSWRSDLSYVFTDNPDTDTSDGQQIISAKLLGYAFLFTIPSRMILVYGKDYYGGDVWPGAYGLKPHIDKLIQINKKFAFGKTITQFVDSKVIVLNRDGNGGQIGHSPGLLTALNFDTFNKRTITCPSTFPEGMILEDYTGRHPKIRVGKGGVVTFTLQSNAWNNGQSYLCFSEAGHDLTVKPVKHSVTQTFFADDDLDIAPATHEGSLTGRIWCDAEKIIKLDKPEGNGVRFSVTDPSGNVVIPKGAWIGEASQVGWHEILAFSPTNTPAPYQVDVTYTSTATLDLSKDV